MRLTSQNSEALCNANWQLLIELSPIRYLAGKKILRRKTLSGHQAYGVAYHDLNQREYELTQPSLHRLIPWTFATAYYRPLTVSLRRTSTSMSGHYFRRSVCCGEYSLCVGPNDVNAQLLCLKRAIRTLAGSLRRMDSWAAILALAICLEVAGNRPQRPKRYWNFEPICATSYCLRELRRFSMAAELPATPVRKISQQSTLKQFLTCLSRSYTAREEVACGEQELWPPCTSIDEAQASVSRLSDPARVSQRGGRFTSYRPAPKLELISH